MAKKPLKSGTRLRKPKAIAPPSPLLPPVKDWKENLIILGWMVTPVVIIVILFFFVSKAIWTRGLDDQLSQWKITYHLTDSVVSQLRQIELDFHGSGNPFTTPIQHSALEIKLHHDRMASLMGKEDGAKFLRNYGSGRLGH